MKTDDETGPGDPKRRSLTTAEAARILGVSDATLKRYVIRGILRANLTAKGHRRIPVVEVLRAAREGNFPDADLSGLFSTVGPSCHATLRRSLAEAVSRPDAASVRSLIFGAIQGGMPIHSLADDIISPVMHDIGSGWESGRLHVMDEHQSTQSLLTALYELRGTMKAPDLGGRFVAVGGAPEHDPYLLPTLLAELSLLEQGWESINLGPHTPASAFLRAIETMRPRLVWISVSHVADPEQFLAAHESVYEFARHREVAVVVGGRALTPELVERMRFTAHGGGLRRLVDFAATFLPPPSKPKRGRPRGKK